MIWNKVIKNDMSELITGLFSNASGFVQHGENVSCSLFTKELPNSFHL